MLPRVSQLPRVLSTARTVARAKSTAAASSASSAPSAASSRDATPSQTSPTKADESALKATSTKKKKDLKSPTDPALDYQRRLEERFGGGEAAALGHLVDGKPEGLARHVKKNMFRLI
ncbi:hypothetical protein JCM1840_002798 [Sporobolomyces johnsonii]